MTIRQGSYVAIFIGALLALSCSDDTGGKLDGGTEGGAGDQGGKDGEKLDFFDPSAPNSGAICNGTCQNSKDICAVPPGSLKGMCLMLCSPGDQCPKPQFGPYASNCAFSYSGSSTGYLCGWFCEYQGMTYKCPNDTDYKCEPANPTEPSVKFCLPK